MCKNKLRHTLRPSPQGKANSPSKPDKCFLTLRGNVFYFLLLSVFSVGRAPPVIPLRKRQIAELSIETEFGFSVTQSPLSNRHLLLTKNMKKKAGYSCSKVGRVRTKIEVLRKACFPKTPVPFWDEQENLESSRTLIPQKSTGDPPCCRRTLLPHPFLVPGVVQHTVPTRMRHKWTLSSLCRGKRKFARWRKNNQKANLRLWNSDMYFSIFQFPNLCIGMWISLSKEFKEGIRCIPLFAPFIGYVMCLHLYTEITAFYGTVHEVLSDFSSLRSDEKATGEIMKRNYSSQLIRTAAPEPNTEGVLACGNEAGRLPKFFFQRVARNWVDFRTAAVYYVWPVTDFGNVK